MSDLHYILAVDNSSLHGAIPFWKTLPSLAAYGANTIRITLDESYPSTFKFVPAMLWTDPKTSLGIVTPTCMTGFIFGDREITLQDQDDNHGPHFTQYRFQVIVQNSTDPSNAAYLSPDPVIINEPG